MKSNFNEYLKRYGFESALDLDTDDTDERALNLRLSRLEREFGVDSIEDEEEENHA